jgi:hypothetical protein
MRVFLLDLWLDLREKRLAPIAILLLAGIIIVPIALSKSATAPPPPPPTATTASAAAAQPIVATPAPAVSSKLQTYSSRDPFESNAATTSTTTSGSSSSTSTSTSTSTTTTPTTGTTGGGTNGTQPTTTTPSTGNTGNTTTGETKSVLFTYTVDLHFGQGNSVKAYKNVQRLDLIPDQTNPKIVFLGVTTSGKTAVFLVDSNIGVDTPGGKCKPSPDECTFLYLRPDGQHDQAILTDADGTVYHMRLTAIHRVTLSTSNGSTTNGKSNGKSGGSNRSPAFTGSVDNGKSNSDQSTNPGGEAPPGEPSQGSTFQQFFADGGGSSGSSDSGGSGH